MHKNMIKSNQTVIATSKPPSITTYNDEFEEDSDTLHMGIAVPLSSEDLEKEIEMKTAELSTQKDGLSTWSLLNGSHNNKIQPTTLQTPTRSSVRHEGKIEKITKTEYDQNNVRRISTTVKPKIQSTIAAVTQTPKTTQTTTTTTRKVQTTKQTKSPNTTGNVHKIKTTTEKPILINNKDPVRPIRVKKTTTTTSTTTMAPPQLHNVHNQPNKKQTNKKNPTTTPAIPTTTISTLPTVATTELFAESSSVPTVESTTFLIMEPKDADFDLPQDRSPGTTKKPKKNKNTKIKKNKITNDSIKKPSKTQLANKDKPFTTKIYNYIAREVMPTVGVGLVGLTVAAGLATYFLAPFGALRRSYDVADRKDDIYFYNNEEYAGQDGQSEEEVFGKVIAGMPVNSPYRNNIRYNVPQQHRHQQPNVVQNGSPGPKYGHYSAQPQQYRVRNVAPANYPAVVQQSHHMQHQTNPVYTKRIDEYPQQFYRYNSEPASASNMYRRTSNTQQYQQSDPNEQKLHDEQTSTESKIFESENSYAPTIVTPEPQPYLNTQMSEINSEKLPDDNVLSKRTQFVVGSNPTNDQQQTTTMVGNDNTAIKSTVDVIPEHGPRKRRHVMEHRENDHENEIDGIVSTESDNVSIIPIPNETSTKTAKVSDEVEETTKYETSNNTSKPTKTPLRPNIFDLLRDIFEVKVRMSLSFLQNTTMAVQRYLQTVERRVDESNIFRHRQKEQSTEIHSTIMNE